MTAEFLRAEDHGELGGGIAADWRKYRWYYVCTQFGQMTIEWIDFAYSKQSCGFSLLHASSPAVWEQARKQIPFVEPVAV